MEMQSKTRVELRLKVKILFKMSNWEKDSGWSRKKNRLITLGHHTQGTMRAITGLRKGFLRVLSIFIHVYIYVYFVGFQGI